MIRELSNHEIDALHYELIVKDIVAAAEKLPAFPDVAWKVTGLLKSMAPIKEVEQLIKYDQAIAARILKLASSAYYGRRYDIQSLQDAILLLGNPKLVQVIVAACASRYFKGGGSKEEQELWEHSVATALMSEVIARRLNHTRMLTLYTATLLHDIAKTILSIYAKIYLHSSLREVRGENDSIRAERRTLGIDHQELGGIIARNWKFPPELTAAIQHHHNPEKAEQFQDITSIVHIADTLSVCWAKKKAKQQYKEIDPDASPVFRKYKITRKIIEDLQSELTHNMEEMRQALKEG